VVITLKVSEFTGYEYSSLYFGSVMFVEIHSSVVHSIFKCNERCE